MIFNFELWFLTYKSQDRAGQVETCQDYETIYFDYSRERSQLTCSGTVFGPHGKHNTLDVDGSPEGYVRDKPQEMNGRKFQTLPPQDQSTRVSPAALNASKLCNLVPGFHYEAQKCQVIETDTRSKQKTRTSTRRSGIGWHNFRSFCPTDSCAPICFRSRANLRKWAHLYLDSLLTYSTIVSVIHVPALCVIPRTVPATVLETWATTSTVVWNGRHDFANTLQVPMCPCERTHIGQTLLCQRHK